MKKTLRVLAGIAVAAVAVICGKTAYDRRKRT